jgi:hypothetical protein
VIIILVVVFDPLAVMMLLAATESRTWNLQKRREQSRTQTDAAIAMMPPITDALPESEPHTSDSAIETDLEIRPQTETEMESISKPLSDPQDLAQADVLEDDDDGNDDDDSNIKAARAQWKKDNPGKTLKEQRHLLERGVIDRLPWEHYLDSPKSSTRLGRAIPGLSPEYRRGDLFVLTGVQPTQLYKFTGDEWIMIDKSTTDQYIHDDAYIEYLIDAVSKGQYDPDLLTELERYEIENKLKTNTLNG